MIQSIGLAAATCTTISFFPQIIQIYRTRSAESISLGMYLIYSIGLFLWTIYGIMISSTPIILANMITLIFALCILFMKLKWTEPRNISLSADVGN